MRNIIPIIVAVALIATACHKVVDPEISVDPYAITCDYNGGSFDVNIRCNVDWTADCDTLGITISPTSGTKDGSIRISVPSTTSKSTQVARITFTAKGEESSKIAKTVVTIGSYPFIGVDVGQLSIAAEGGGTQFLLTANRQWSATSSNPAFTFSPENGAVNDIIRVTADVNNTGSPRECIINFKLKEYQNKTAQIKIVQTSL
ncbi:MAG TPA: BACON domain-containing protein [Bacteroidales bacterium]|nr:BACON domain-containing protein [Bacteroidales bacterium]HPK29500.1 BACON domain-containing protein [Bacteroidales bacterium]